MTSQIINIGIPGAAGRMGRMLIREIDAASDLQLVAATDRAEIDAIGRGQRPFCRYGEQRWIIGHDATGLGIADVIIDFTSPAASVAHAGMASHECALVVGTTGLAEADEERLRTASRRHSPRSIVPTPRSASPFLASLLSRWRPSLSRDGISKFWKSHHHHKVDAVRHSAGARPRGGARPGCRS